MQVKVQTVSELTINQMSDDQYKAEKAAGRISAGEVYACTPSPVKWEDIQGKPDVSQGSSVDDFYQWLKERNYDLTNFRGLEGVFPVKTLAPFKVNDAKEGDTALIGTAAPHVVVVYDEKQTQSDAGGKWTLLDLKPLPSGLIAVEWLDYAGRKNAVNVNVKGGVSYCVPNGTVEVTKDMVAQYGLNRAGKLEFPPSVKKIGAQAFKSCENVTEINPPNCEELGNDAFDYCSALTSVSLPVCTIVGEFTFYLCSRLTSVSLPVCTSVGNNAFYGCTKLQTVILSDGWKPSKGPVIPTTATVYNPDKTKKVDWNTMSWVNV